MRTDNKAIIALIDDITQAAQTSFADRLGGIYVMGSLARGGFSEAVSDIDLGIILASGLMDGDADLIEQIQVAAAERHPFVKNKASIFWGNVASLNGETETGRCPPFDRLDLIDHALLLAGEDLRSELVRPSQQELEVSNVAFALDYLGNDKVIAELLDSQQIVERGMLYTSKTILYPTRFIYVARTGKVAGNDASHDFYVENYSGSEVELVRLGYQLRVQPTLDDTGHLNQLLQRGMVTLYLNFLDIYISRMAEYGELELHVKLLAWRESITRG